MLSGEKRRLFPQSSTSFTPQWSPDGQKLAVYLREGDQSLSIAVWLKKANKYIRYEQATARPRTAWDVMKWTPDSQSIIFRRSFPKPSTPSQPFGISVSRHRLGSDTPTPEKTTDPSTEKLTRLDLESGQLETLVSGVNALQWKVSPDGENLAYFQHLHTPKGSQTHTYQLAISPVKQRKDAMVFTEQVATGSWSPLFDWSPDSKHIAYSCDGKVFLTSTHQANSPQTAVGLPGGVHFSSGGEIPFLWSPESDSIYLQGTDGIGVYSTETRDTQSLGINLKNTRWLRKGKYNPHPNPRTKTAYVISEDNLLKIDFEARRVVESKQIERRGGPETIVSEDLSSAYFKTRHRIYKLDTPTGKEVRIFSLTPPISREHLNIKTIKWDLPDGDEAAGELLLPPDYKQDIPLPTVIQVYAGDRGRMRPEIVEPALLASRGYAVFFPDLPLKGGNPMAQIPTLLDSATDAVLATGYSDEKKLAILGHSYGAYTVLSTLIASSRYRTGIACNGPTDLLLAYHLGMEGWVKSGQGATGGTPWEKRETYIQNSPYFYLDKVETPVLLITSPADTIGFLPMKSAFQALQRLDKPAELRIYEGSQHGPVAWPASQKRDLHLAVFQWLDSHMK
ncbi:MAG: prolyl oligopeptidase family serine peptidase [Planctomycetota bacterium]